MTPTTHHSAPLRRQLTDKLSADGFLRGSRWEEAFLAVPREAFVSRFVLHDPSGERAEHDLATDGAALEAIYTNASLITRHDAGGTPTSSSTSPSLMALMLERLDAHPGHRVLEIGTGSGYSSALLSHAVGPSGHVVTLDIDDALIARAHDLHRRAGTTNVDPRVGDGYQGWAAGGPYDRIIAWATPHVLPRPWMEQVTPGAVVVTSVKVAEVALANAVLRCHVTGGQPWLLSPHPGSMIEMHARVLTEFRLPIRYVDAARHTPQGPCWISGAALHAHPSAAAELLRDLTPTMTPLPSAPENRDGFKAWVLATHPDQAATAGDPEGWGIGLAGHDSAAVVRPDGTIHHAGSDRLLHQLRRSVRAWNDAGQPGFEALTAHAHPTAEGWAVRVSRRQQGLTGP